MLGRVTTILVVSVLVVAVMAMTAFAAQTAAKGKAFKKMRGAQAYSFDDGHGMSQPNGEQRGHSTLGTVQYFSSSASPGRIVGGTVYEYQHNCSMGRMIETGPHSGITGPATVHFGWMYMATAEDFNHYRSYAYNAYSTANHQYAGEYVLHEDPYSGYVNVDVTPDNRGIVGGHTDLHSSIPYQPQIHFDACSACEDFAAFVRVPDSVAGYPAEAAETSWPKFFFQFGSDTVLHIAAMEDAGRLYMKYFRCVGYEGVGTWDYPPYVIDTVEDIAQDITGERLGDRVCMSWFACPPYQEPWCDTCSGLPTPGYDGTGWAQMDNDIYIQTSDDQGVTWNPRQNITNVGPYGEPAWKAYCDASILFDQSGYLHLIWHGCPWPADPELDAIFEEDWDQVEARLFHWSENVPYIRTIADHNYSSGDSCGPPIWGINVAKMTLSECDGKLYALFTQFNDIPNNVENDCAEWGYPDVYWGAANGDLWVSISSDGGMTWDAQRNLTNSYSPHCDPVAGEDCQNDYWASMVRWGRQVQTGEDWSAAEIVDPSGGASPTDFYLDIQYVNDIDAGGAVQDEGTWQYCPIKWFRMPCVEPVAAPLAIFTPTRYGDPAWGHPGEQVDSFITIENAGNMELNWTATVEEYNGAAGWLRMGSYAGTIPSGMGNVATAEVIFNYGGAQTEHIVLEGALVFNGNDPKLPKTIPVSFIVTDTVQPPVFDTVHTDCLALMVSSTGNMGNSGRAGVTMDYIRSGDCDPNATNYLYDGSPVIGWINDGDTAFNWAIWDATWLNDKGFRPQYGELPTKTCEPLNAEVFHSGIFTTHDTTIAFEKISVAPLDDCPFVLQYMKVYSFDGNAHSGLMIGEGIDWDIPWDYHDDDPEGDVWTVCNYGGFDVTRSLVYQQGYEASWDNGDPDADCQRNDARFGGNAFVESYFNGAHAASVPYSGFVQENELLQSVDGFIAGLFYQEMMNPGLSATDSIEDLHSAMCFTPSLDLGATDYYEVVTVLATVHEGDLGDLLAAVDAGKAWYTANGGMTMFADVDGENGIDVCGFCCEIMGDLNDDKYLDPLDITFFVNWLWKGGPPPPCEDQVDVNGDGADDPLDLTHLVNYVWKGGPPPVPCQ
ncbi:MAG: dockerin type I domain-containing protein [Candidatus Zixiibacteriota bacterium]